MAERVVLPLEDRRLKAVFSYPHFSRRHYEAVIGDLRRLGVDGVVLAGELEAGEAKMIGKGCTAVVCLGLMHGLPVAVKIRRSDSCRESLEGEGSNLEFANSFGVGPRLFGVSKNAIAMEHIRGLNLARWLESGPQSETVKYMVREVLEQCHALDSHGLDHGELSNAKKHIIIKEGGGACIIDFESASRTRKCRNLTSVVNYIFFKDSISRLIGLHIGVDRKMLSEIMMRYKASPSDRALGALFSHLKLY